MWWLKMRYGIKTNFLLSINFIVKLIYKINLHNIIRKVSTLVLRVES